MMSCFANQDLEKKLARLKAEEQELDVAIEEGRADERCLIQIESKMQKIAEALIRQNVNNQINRYNQ